MFVQPVILCGGSGTRLWPLSRELYPKQLINLVADESLLQSTIGRLQGLSDCRSPQLICNEEHRFLVAEQMRQLGIEPGSILLEPEGKNTAPALTLAALSAQSEDDILLAMPADHVIRNGNAFRDAVTSGVKRLSSQPDTIITFGIVPAGVETGYGYIQKAHALKDDAFEVERFVEKPDYETAKSYVESGNFLWNSGIFMVTANAWLQQIEKLSPKISEVCKIAYEKRKEEHDFIRVHAKTFSDCPSDSIDYAVIEKTQGPIVVISLDAGWSDVGAWSSLWEISEQDDNGNVIRGDVQVHDVENSLLFADRRLVSAVGVRDMIVVDTDDAVLVAQRDRVQDVKKLVQDLRKTDRPETQLHRLVYRPWGYYDSIDQGPRFQVKRIVVKPGAALSLQLHHHRAEHWVVVKGVATVTCGEKTFDLHENESTYIPIEVKHRLENRTAEPVELIEVQSGDYLGEDDIVRFDDVYGRN